MEQRPLFSDWRKDVLRGRLEGAFKFSFKVKPDEFEELTTKLGIVPAPYLARYHWVLVENPGVFSKKETEHYIRQSYEMVKAKLPSKVLKKLTR